MGGAGIGVEAGFVRRAGIAAVAAIFGEQHAVARFDHFERDMAALGEIFAIAVEEDDRCGGLVVWCFVADGQGEVVFGFYADGFCTCFQFRVFEGFDLFQRIDKAALQPIEPRQSDGVDQRNRCQEDPEDFAHRFTERVCRLLYVSGFDFFRLFAGLLLGLGLALVSPDPVFASVY
ncbi:protein of unknown function (plasmid) [Caballeronia sp. S22]